MSICVVYVKTSTVFFWFFFYSFQQQNYETFASLLIPNLKCLIIGFCMMWCINLNGDSFVYSCGNQICLLFVLQGGANGFEKVYQQCLRCCEAFYKQAK